MNPIIPFTVALPSNVAFAFSLDTLMERFSQVVDRRKRRGHRYALDLMLTVLGRLAGQTHLEPLADLVQLRAADLATLFGLSRTTMPHQHT